MFTRLWAWLLGQFCLMAQYHSSSSVYKITYMHMEHLLTNVPAHGDHVGRFFKAIKH